MGFQIATPALTWPAVIVPPKVDSHCEMISGESPAATAARLADRLIEEKVL
jgi:hypothetical protein